MADLPQGHEGWPDNYDGSVFTLSDLKAYGRACASEVRAKKDEDAAKLKARIADLEDTVRRIRQMTRNALNPFTKHLEE